MFKSRRKEVGAAIYRLRKEVLVHSLNRAVSGVWIAGDFALLLPETVPPVELGAAVAQALRASKHDVPHPSDWAEVGRQVLSAARKKTWRAIEKVAVLTHVFSDGRTMRATPTRNGGSTGADRGFHLLTDRELTIGADVPAAELGSTIITALEASE